MQAKRRRWERCSEEAEQEGTHCASPMKPIQPVTRKITKKGAVRPGKQFTHLACPKP